MTYLERLERITNSWPRMKKIIAFVLRWKMKVKSINVEILEKAERAIIRLVQKDAFPKEMKNLTDRQPVKRSSNILKLTPFLSEDDELIRVGGRTQMGNNQAKHTSRRRGSAKRRNTQKRMEVGIGRVRATR